MKALRSIISISLLAGVMAVSMACRSSSGDDDDTPDGGGTGDTTIYQIQDPAEGMADGTPVTVRDVVVVAIDNYGGHFGSVYVMEPGGGAYSGVVVSVSSSEAEGLALGDLIDVEGGVKDEFTLETDTCTRASDCTITEIYTALEGAITLTKVGEGTVPEPEVLNPWDLAADETEAEKWEGVLIKFENVRAFGAPHNVTQTDDTLKEFDMTGPFIGSSGLTSLDSIAEDDCLASITGIGDYFFDYKMLPRSAADIGAGGTSCLAEEEGDTACGDEADNDHDGFADCADFSCQDTVAACTTTTTVVDLQSDQVPENSAVRLEGVVVTAIEFGEHLWVQDATVNAHHNGIYVHRGTDPPALDNQIQVGQLVDVTGTFKYYNGLLTELGDAEVTFVAGGPVEVEVLTDADTDSLADAISAVPWDGTVVRMTNVPVINGVADSHGQTTIGNSGSPLHVDDVAYNYDGAGDLDGITCLAEITGIVHYNTFDHWYTLLPRSAADIVGGGTCN